MNPLKRSNSCSTIYLHETVSQPNMKNTIKAVALGIHNLIKNRRGYSFYHQSEGDLHMYDDADRQMLANLEIFDERAHPLTVSPCSSPNSVSPFLQILSPHPLQTLSFADLFIGVSLIFFLCLSHSCFNAYDFITWHFHFVGCCAIRLCDSQPRAQDRI